MPKENKNEVPDKSYQQKIQHLKKSIERVQNQKIEAKRVQKKLLEKLEAVTKQRHLNQLEQSDPRNNGGAENVDYCPKKSK